MHSATNCTVQKHKYLKYVNQKNLVNEGHVPSISRFDEAIKIWGKQRWVDENACEVLKYGMRLVSGVRTLFSEWRIQTIIARCRCTFKSAREKLLPADWNSNGKLKNWFSFHHKFIVAVKMRFTAFNANDVIYKWMVIAFSSKKWRIRFRASAPFLHILPNGDEHLFKIWTVLYMLLELVLLWGWVQTRYVQQG